MFRLARPLSWFGLIDSHRAPAGAAETVAFHPQPARDGLHSHEEIPVMLGETESVVQERYRNGQPTWRNPTEKQDKRIWYTASIGSEPQIADVIVERVRQMAAS